MTSLGTTPVERVNVGGDPSDPNQRHWRERIIIQYQSRNGIQSVLTNFDAVTNGICVATRWFGAEWKREAVAALIKALQKSLACKFIRRNDFWVVQTELKVADVEKGIQAFIKRHLLCPKCAQPEWNGSSSCKGCGHHVSSSGGGNTKAQASLSRRQRRAKPTSGENKRTAATAAASDDDDDDASASSRVVLPEVQLMWQLYRLRRRFKDRLEKTCVPQLDALEHQVAPSSSGASDRDQELALLKQEVEFVQQVIDRANYLLDKCWHMPPPPPGFDPESKTSPWAQAVAKMSARVTLLFDAAAERESKWSTTTKQPPQPLVQVSHAHLDMLDNVQSAAEIKLCENSTDADKRAEVRLFCEWKNRHLPEAARATVPSSGDVSELDALYSHVCGTDLYAQFLQTRSVVSELSLTGQTELEKPDARA